MRKSGFIFNEPIFAQLMLPRQIV